MKRAAAMLLACAASGCMHFNGHELPKREARGAGDPPVIELEVGDVRLTLNGGFNWQSPIRGGTLASIDAGDVLRDWKAAGLIRAWGKPGELSEPATYRLTISGTLDQQNSVGGQVLTGATFFLVPSAETFARDLSFRLTRLRTGETHDVPVRQTVTRWDHLLFLPALPFAAVGIFTARGDRSRYVWSEFDRMGAWMPVTAAQ